MVKLFIVGYPLDIQDADLIELFAIQGMVHSIQLVTDKLTGKHKGFGFVEMVDRQGAQRAIEALHGRMIAGRKLTVKVADERNEDKPRSLKGIGSDKQGGVSVPGSNDQLKNKRPRKAMSNR